MLRFLTVLALAGLLVACTGQGEGTTDQPTASAVSAPTTASPDASDAAGSSASAECTDSFAALADTGATSITELGDLPDEVAPTIESCESVDEWIAAAQETIGDEFNPNTAELLLRMNCDDLSLANSTICRELASS